MPSDGIFEIIFEMFPLVRTFLEQADFYIHYLYSLFFSDYLVLVYLKYQIRVRMILEGIWMQSF